MKTRCIAIIIGMLLIAGTALAISPETGVITDTNGSVKSTEPCDNFSSSILPRDFDYAKGYGIEKIGENRYVAYITMPMNSEEAGDKAEGIKNWS